MDTQTEHLSRVNERIAEAILAFCLARTEWFADELRAFVIEHCGKVAPGSPDRVLRDLRQRRMLDYRCVDRAASLYRRCETRPPPHILADESGQTSWGFDP